MFLKFIGILLLLQLVKTKLTHYKGPGKIDYQCVEDVSRARPPTDLTIAIENTDEFVKESLKLNDEEFEPICHYYVEKLFADFLEYLLDFIKCFTKRFYNKNVEAFSLIKEGYLNFCNLKGKGRQDFLKAYNNKGCRPFKYIRVCVEKDADYCTENSLTKLIDCVDRINNLNGDCNDSQIKLLIDAYRGVARLSEESSLCGKDHIFVDKNKQFLGMSI